jgi:hypothetical protein
VAISVPSFANLANYAATKAAYQCHSTLIFATTLKIRATFVAFNATLLHLFCHRFWKDRNFLLPLFKEDQWGFLRAVPARWPLAV